VIKCVNINVLLICIIWLP